MNKLQRMLVATAIGCISTLSTSVYADATNFSYTTLSVGVGKVSYKDPLYIAGERYTELGGAGLSGSYQFADDWLVVSLGAQSVANSGPTTKLTSSAGYLELDVVKAIGSRADIYAGVASLSATTEACLGSICVKADDTGTEYTAGLNVWFDDAKKVAGHVAVSSSKYSKDTKTYTNTGLGLSFYFTKNHAVSFDYASNDSASAASLSYAYHF